ncbi:MAG: Trk system potassium transporter TrkA, partial [Bacteroidetes bacterium]
MKIVIAGAGGVGFHLAELLSYEDQDIVLIDTNKDVLDYAGTHLDVLTILGDASSEEILEAAEVQRARLFLAVTTNQHTNLVMAQMAKQMGARQTIARVSFPEYLEEPWLGFFQRTGVDSLISPRKLAALEIQRLVRQCSFTDVLEFEEGKMVIVGFTLDEHSPLLGKPLRDITHSGFYQGHYRPIAILRGNRTIIPHGDTVLRFNDHVYFISPREELEKLETQIGRKQVDVKRIMIVGGSGLGYETARLLEQDYQVTLVERDKDRCRLLSELLNDTLVIH